MLAQILGPIVILILVVIGLGVWSLAVHQRPNDDWKDQLWKDRWNDYDAEEIL